MTTQEKLNEIDSIRSQISDINYLIYFIDKLNVGSVNNTTITIQEEIKDDLSTIHRHYRDEYFTISGDDLKEFVLHHKDDLIKKRELLKNNLDIILK